MIGLKKTIDMKIGDKISFRYKGNRKVKGIINALYSKVLTLTLETDYIGRNVEWFEGEEKDFNISEMKKIANY